MLTRENIICCITSILLIVYMVVTFIVCNNRAAAATAPADSPVIIAITGGDTNRFVTTAEVQRLIAPWLPERAGEPIVTSSINTFEMEARLNDVDNIEWARCSRTAADRLLVEIVPMKPVARIFDGDSSYYVNRQGKRLTASLRYRSDVPVIQGHARSAEQIRSLMPLLDTISARTDLRELVTSIQLTKGPDVILIPSIRGHVVNFGSPDRDIADKFDRLTTMYRQVLPVKGWDFYDTLSVKFARQVVATRRSPTKKAPVFIADPEGDAREEITLSAMAQAAPATPAPAVQSKAPALQAKTPTPQPKSPAPGPTEDNEPIIVIEQ